MDNTEWQELVTPEKRSSFINNLIQAMIPSQTTGAENTQDLCMQANQLENEIYENAMSRADYYNQIAQQVYKIRDNVIKQTPTNSTELEDLFANLNLTEITFEDDENKQELELATGNETIQNLEQEDKITFHHVKIWYMLLHAFECVMTNNGDVQCVIPYCGKFQNLLMHLINCKEANSCPEYLCRSSRVLITHWAHCKEEKCLLCKKANELKKPTDPVSEKEWYNTCTFELREHLINKLIKAIGFLPPPIVVAYMRKLEKEMYETANSRSEYYILLAEKMTTFSKQLRAVRRSS